MTPQAIDIVSSIILIGYIGPGLSTGVVATVIGLIGSLFIAFFAIIWYPMKRMLKRMRANKTGKQLEEPDVDSNDS